ncbi:MAG TPA: LPS-assembly protein LptD, partial [Oceanithermus profundus]|nr:LPS-assembly protein LptD [Oceanithermus profundus]
MRAAVWVLLALLAGWALAGRIEVTQADRLELRKVGDRELVVLVGAPVILKLEKGEEVRADRVEYDRAARRLILIGQVYYQDAQGRVTEADYLELYLDDESLDALEVHIQSGGIDLWGPEATRVMGQILLTQGEFTPCARCGQDPYDYSFKARKVILYPGDRLVAYDVTVYTRGEV